MVSVSSMVLMAPVRGVVGNWLIKLPFLLVWMLLHSISCIYRAVAAATVSVPAYCLGRVRDILWAYAKGSATRFKLSLPFTSNCSTHRSLKALPPPRNEYNTYRVYNTEGVGPYGSSGARRQRRSDRKSRKAIAEALTKLLLEPCSPSDSDEDSEAMRSSLSEEVDERSVKLIMDLLKLSKSDRDSQVKPTLTPQDLQALRERTRNKQQLESLITEVDQIARGVDSSDSVILIKGQGQSSQLRPAISTESGHHQPKRRRKKPKSSSSQAKKTSKSSSDTYKLDQDQGEGMGEGLEEEESSQYTGGAMAPQHRQYMGDLSPIQECQEYKPEEMNYQELEKDLNLALSKLHTEISQLPSDLTKETQITHTMTMITSTEQQQQQQPVEEDDSLFLDYSTIEQLNSPSLKDILMEISTSEVLKYSIMQSWEDIGIQLNIADEELAAIKRKHTTSTMDGSRHNSDQAFQDMIRFWVKQVNPPPTWSNFVKALERLNIDQKLTDQLRSKYCGTIDKKIRHTSKLPPSVSMYYQCSQNIASVPFLTQVEVLTCDSSGCEYYSYDHGITLRIPGDAIPPGMVIHLEVAVALYGPFQFPDGSCPISPILWWCIQENVNLRKPIDIILPHFLTDTKNFVIGFAKADHKQYSTDEFGQNRYIFQPLETAFIAYKERNQNYGILSTQHCCFLCITSNNPQISPDYALKAGYYLWCIEKPSSDSLTSSARDTLHFCATFCLPTCRELLKSQYTEKEGYYIRRPPKVFTFKDSGDASESCLLIEVRDEGCVMAADPENKLIKASQVYFWDDKRDKLELLQADKVYPPSVILTLEVLGNLPVKLLIKFNGSTADNNMGMEIVLPLARNSHIGPSSLATIDHESHWITIDKPELSTVLRELINKVDCKWENLGILLRIESHRLESVKTAECKDPQNCLREMLKIWLNKINPPPSWSAITDALECLGKEHLAHDLRSKYIH